ncbi:MAG: hypothetical protein FWD71_09500 [Oscillospiraceae bacterium]|nr:hypothetical protein [Oscillospiraceae bacterium]
MKLLCDRGRRNHLNSILLEGLNEHNPEFFAENDAVDKNGEPVMLAYDCDMHRIKRFNSALQLHSRSGTMICFDFQADVLRRFCCDNVKFQLINLSKFERRFFP